MNKALLNTAVQDFILKNRTANLSKLILKGSPFKDVSIQEIAIQIAGLSKAKSKLPTWYLTKNILFPPNLNLEQTSSEKTARYKASLVEGKKIIDLTGGFGIDSYFFAERFKEVIHCELNMELSELAEHNFEILNATNVKTIQGDGIEYLKNSEQYFDWIYLDPSRRDDAGGKVFQLSDCTPNPAEHLDLFFEKADHILIKTSPLLDLKAGIGELKNVSEIHIVAVNQEVKELLWILNKNASEEIKVKTIHFQNKITQSFETNFSDSQSDIPLSLPLNYLYEPNPAIMKSGMFRELASQTDSYTLHSNSHLFTSKQLKDFPGRRFEILEVLPYNKKLLKQRLTIKKANITIRNFPKTVAEIRKELKIEDGGESYLFFTTNLNEKRIVVVCKKISNLTGL
ncbi:MAG: class I SAM-dependent methyltransferase [Flavobacteriaceae bacterium]|nr:class I SAM-dependent methyltransferase [Flavobacteriaceae bacterium]